MRKETLAREVKWKEESLEEVLRKIRSEDVKRLEQTTLGLRKENTPAEGKKVNYAVLGVF